MDETRLRNDKDNEMIFFRNLKYEIKLFKHSFHMKIELLKIKYKIWRFKL